MDIVTRPWPRSTARMLRDFELRWIHQFDTTESTKSESTPIVVGGIIFTTEPPATVVALDAENRGRKMAVRSKSAR